MWVAVAGVALLIAFVLGNSFLTRHLFPALADDRAEIVVWANADLGDDLYTLVHQFEQRNPQYKVTVGTAVARDLTGDAQRLLSAVAGGVPPDLVWFDRFAIGEWAGRGALLDLRPRLEAQAAGDSYRIDLDEYYDWAVAETSYAPPGEPASSAGIFGVPTTADVRVLFSNNDLLRQEGLIDADGRPQPPVTWAELREYATRLSRFDRPGDSASGLRRLGFAPNFGNSWLYLYAFAAGGELLSADGTTVLLDSPPVVRALKYMTSIYDDLGGVAQVDAFQSGLQQGELDPFLAGQVAMKIDGDWGLAQIADWRPNMDFAVTVPPMPADRLAAGAEPVTWAGGFSWVIPATAGQQDGAFELMQFLTSWEATQLLERGKQEARLSAGRTYMPRALANRVHYERVVEELVHDNPQVPETFRRAYDTLAELLPNTRIRPVTPVGQLLWNQHIVATDAALNHKLAATARRRGEDETKLTLASEQRIVQDQLDRLLAPPPPTKVVWWPYFLGYLALLAAPIAAIVFVHRRGRRRRDGYRADDLRTVGLFMAPWVLGFAIFIGGPILFSIVLSFTRYDVLSEARYAGAGNYAAVLGDPLFLKSLVNTLYMVIRIPLVMAAGLAIAMLLNTAVRGIGVYRTAFYMPAIVPLVAASLLWVWLFNPAHGAINGGLAWLFDTPPLEALEWLVGRLAGGEFAFAPPLWLQDPDWSKPALIVMGLWTAGGGMVIWLAGLQSISPQLYEAAAVDGAGPVRQFWNVTLPMLSPYILFNLIVGLIGTMQIFGEAYIMTAGGPVNSTLFYAYYLFKQAFQYFNMGYASALAWILFLIVLGLTLLQLWLSKRWVHYEEAT